VGWNVFFTAKGMSGVEGGGGGVRPFSVTRDWPFFA